MEKELDEDLINELEGLMYMVGYEWGSRPDNYRDCIRKAKAIIENTGKDAQKKENADLMAAINKVAEASGVELKPNGVMAPHPLSSLKVLYVKIKRKTDPKFTMSLNESLTSRVMGRTAAKLPQSNFEDIYNTSRKIIR